MTARSNVLVRDTQTGTCLMSNFSTRRLIDTYCSFPNMSIFNHGFKCFSWSLISECVSMFRFVSLFRLVIRTRFFFGNSKIQFKWKENYSFNVQVLPTWNLPIARCTPHSCGKEGRRKCSGWQHQGCVFQSRKELENFQLSGRKNDLSCRKLGVF